MAWREEEHRSWPCGCAHMQSLLTTPTPPLQGAWHRVTRPHQLLDIKQHFRQGYGLDLGCNLRKRLCTQDWD